MGKRGAQALEKNSFWKGGRTIASNGYVLVKMPGHHLADVRGYVYEHRLVLEEVLGRPLAPGEMPHHINGIKADNRPENLELVVGRAAHAYLHRDAGSQLRKPGEPNVEIECGCGCGARLWRYDASGRPRAYISGHNPQASPTADAILAIIRRGPATRADIAAEIGKSPAVVSTTLGRLRATGLASPLRHGLWIGGQ